MRIPSDSNVMLKDDRPTARAVIWLMREARVVAREVAKWVKRGR